MENYDDEKCIVSEEIWQTRTLETRVIAGTERYYGVAVRSPLAAMREPAGVDICRTLIEQLLVAA
jgi:hypothetical protein